MFGIMKTSALLTLSTSVLVGVLDISSASFPPPPDYAKWNYNLATQTASTTSKYPSSTGTLSPATNNPYVVELPPYSLPEAGDDLTNPPPIPDIEEADEFKHPFTLPDPPKSISKDGFYYGRNGERIPVVIRPPGFGENPQDRGQPRDIPQSPPPLPGDVVYGDGVKRFSDNAILGLPESESALMLSDVTGEEPSPVIDKRKKRFFHSLVFSFVFFYRAKRSVSANKKNRN